jgi:L-asparaginase
MKIVIHGGFFSESSQSDETKKSKQKALNKVIERSYDYLMNHSALDTVVFATALLEDCPLFNAGIGSQIQRDGIIRMSAAVMDGLSLKFSGVINIENIQNPVLVAQKLLNEKDRILSGIGAKLYASRNGFDDFSTLTPERRLEFELKKNSSNTGTVGCVALDKKGHLAASTSTGGKGFEIPGRVSDSGTIAGNYSNQHCAVSCTGVGEDIISAALASTIVTRVTDGMSIESAFEKSFKELNEINGFAGAIGLDSNGNIYWKESHPKIVFASYDGVSFHLFQ